MMCNVTLRYVLHYNEKEKFLTKVKSMPIIPKWEDNEKTIIYVQFIDDWSWSEFTPVREIIVEMLGSVSHMVDYIADFQEVDHIPIGALAIGRSIHKSCIHNEGVAVIVGISPILRMLFQSFTAAYPASKKELVLVPTLDKANQAIIDIQQNRSKN